MKKLFQQGNHKSLANLENSEKKTTRLYFKHVLKGFSYSVDASFKEGRKIKAPVLFKYS